MNSKSKSYISSASASAAIQLPNLPLKASEDILRRRRRAIVGLDVSRHSNYSVQAKAALERALNGTFHKEQQKITEKNYRSFVAIKRTKPKSARIAHRQLKELNKKANLSLMRKATKMATDKAIVHHSRCTNAKNFRRADEIKLAIKETLIKNYSQRFVMRILITATRKHYKKKSAVQIQAAARGYLTRKSVIASV